MERHEFKPLRSPAEGFPMCASCGQRPNAKIHLSDDVVDDRRVPFEADTQSPDEVTAVNAGSGACSNFTPTEGRAGICKHCKVEDYFHGVDARELEEGNSSVDEEGKSEMRAKAPSLSESVVSKDSSEKAAPTFMIGDAPLYTQADLDRYLERFSQYRKFLAQHDECVECGDAACRGVQLFPMRINGKTEARCWNCLNLTEKRK